MSSTIVWSTKSNARDKSHGSIRTDDDLSVHAAIKSIILIIAGAVEESFIAPIWSGRSLSWRKFEVICTQKNSVVLAATGVIDMGLMSVEMDLGLRRHNLRQGNCICSLTHRKQHSITR